MTPPQAANEWLLRVLDPPPHVARVTHAHGGSEAVYLRDELDRLHQDGTLVPIIRESREAWLAFRGFSVTLRMAPHRTE